MKLVCAIDIVNNTHFNLSSVGGWPRGGDVIKAYELLSTSSKYNMMIKDNSDFCSWNGINWLAPWESVKNEIRDYDTSANDKKITRIRDYLGLAHFSQDEVLLLLIIPKSDLENQNAHKPTTLDAGTNLVFKASSNNNQPGKTIDLANLEVEGSDELITGRVKFSNRIKLDLIGRILERGYIDWGKLKREIPKNELIRLKKEIEEVAKKR